MPTYTYGGYTATSIPFPGGTATAGETVTFISPTNLTVAITDNDTTLIDGLDDRDDEDTSQTAVVTSSAGATLASGQIQPRERIVLSGSTGSHVMHRVFIAAQNAYFYVFENPPPSLNVQYTVTSVTTPNSTAYWTANPGVVCFVRGALIDTPAGPRRVELLAPGDLVTTADHGAQPLRWIGRRLVGKAAMTADPRLAPFRIRAGCFGPGRPAQDLWLSRQHRVLLGPEIAGGAEALAPVHALLDARFIARCAPPFGVEYVHLLFDRHEVLFANGLAVESLLLTGQTPDLVGRDDWRTLRRLLPALAGPAAAKMAPARQILPPREARRIAAAWTLPLSLPRPGRSGPAPHRGTDNPHCRPQRWPAGEPV